MIAIGVDAGTSIVKSAAFDDGGQILAEASRSVTTYAPAPGLAEQDLEEIVAAVGSTVQEVSLQVGKPIDLLALTAQGDGLWLLDDGGRAVRPPILWSDARGAPYVREWWRKGIAAAAFRRSGNAPFSGAASALIRALADQEPESLAGAAVASSCKDALLQRLTGAVVTDISDASLPFLNLRSRQYDEELIDLFRVRPWRYLLPPIDPVPAPLRQLTRTGAQVVGLPEGTPVHAGPFDFPATMLGAGVDLNGDGLIALGTTLACGVNVNRLDHSNEPAGMTICRPEWDRWIRLLPAMAGMSGLDWFLPLIGVDYRSLNDLLEATPPGAHGVLTLPLFSPAGERAPFVDPAARGRIIGLSTATTQADLARAVCEGIAYAARHCLETGGLRRDGEISLCGGGSRAVAFRQLLADALGRRVTVAKQPATGARGAVIAALEAGGASVDRAAWTQSDLIVEPDPEAAQLYAAGYQRYREEVDHARGKWSGPIT